MVVDRRLQTEEKVSLGKERVPLTFKYFKVNKEKERAQHFQPSTKSKGKLKRKLATSEDLNATVKINVGIMLFDGHCN